VAISSEVSTMSLAPGTPCFLIRLVEHPEFIGRTVEVVEPPSCHADDDLSCAPWVTVTSHWIHEMFEGRDLRVPRSRLLPIVDGTAALRERTKTKGVSDGRYHTS